MSCEIQKSLTLRSPPSCTSNNIDHVAESSRERLCLKKPFFISLFSAKINSHQPPRKMAFVVGLRGIGFWLIPRFLFLIDDIGKDDSSSN